MKTQHSTGGWLKIIGNPPYQETKEDTSDTPVYNDFMDAAFEVADKVELITPARFLFNAGKTPKAWNEKMLSDEHFKVLQYEADATRVFPNTSINGGVAITYRDSVRTFGATETFTPFEELNNILIHMGTAPEDSLYSIAYSPETYGFTDSFHKDFPYAEERLSKGHSNDVVTNVFDKLSEAFIETAADDSYARFLGRADNKRAYRYIKKQYVEGPANFSKYKVFIPKSDGAAGTVGKPIPARISGMPLLALPFDGHTQTFMSLGAFDTKEEAENLLKYIKTKFARCLLGVLKVTQHNPPEKWKHIPLQDFTNKSDIDWSTSLKNIDRQLYKKYDLTEEEIRFIETHVKEMK